MTNEGVSQMNIGQDKNIDEGLKCPPHLSEASTLTEAPTVFNHPEFGELRTVEIDGVVWFVGKDVAEALGYSNTKDAITAHVASEDKKLIQRSEITTLEIPNRGMTIINESGLYSLILSSKLPSAKEFKHWVTTGEGEQNFVSP